MRIYISGAISGIEPKKAERKFAKAENQLKSLNHFSFNPFTYGQKTCKTWVEYMMHGFKKIAESDGIYMINGWENPCGARAEYEFAKGLANQKPFLIVTESQMYATMRYLELTDKAIETPAFVTDMDLFMKMLKKDVCVTSGMLHDEYGWEFRHTYKVARSCEIASATSMIKETGGYSGKGWALNENYDNCMKLMGRNRK